MELTKIHSWSQLCGAKMRPLEVDFSHLWPCSEQGKILDFSVDVFTRFSLDTKGSFHPELHEDVQKRNMTDFPSTNKLKPRTFFLTDLEGFMTVFWVGLNFKICAWRFNPESRTKIELILVEKLLIHETAFPLFILAEDMSPGLVEGIFELGIVQLWPRAGSFNQVTLSTFPLRDSYGEVHQLTSDMILLKDSVFCHVVGISDRSVGLFKFKKEIFQEGLFYSASINDDELFHSKDPAHLSLKVSRKGYIMVYEPNSTWSVNNAELKTVLNRKGMEQLKTSLSVKHKKFVAKYSLEDAPLSEQGLGNLCCPDCKGILADSFLVFQLDTSLSVLALFKKDFSKLVLTESHFIDCDPGHNCYKKNRTSYYYVGCHCGSHLGICNEGSTIIVCMTDEIPQFFPYSEVTADLLKTEDLVARFIKCKEVMSDMLCCLIACNSEQFSREIKCFLALSRSVARNSKNMTNSMKRGLEMAYSDILEYLLAWTHQQNHLELHFRSFISRRLITNLLTIERRVLGSMVETFPEESKLKLLIAQIHNVLVDLRKLPDIRQEFQLTKTFPESSVTGLVGSLSNESDNELEVGN